MGAIKCQGKMRSSRLSFVYLFILYFHHLSFLLVISNKKMPKIHLIQLILELEALYAENDAILAEFRST